PAPLPGGGGGGVGGQGSLDGPVPPPPPGSAQGRPQAALSPLGRGDSRHGRASIRPRIPVEARRADDVIGPPKTCYGSPDRRACAQAAPRINRSLTTMNDGEVRLVCDGGVARVTFDRPAARNAMTWRMYEQLGDICNRLKGDASVRVVVLRGAGGKAFVAGTDIAQFLEFK